VFFFDYWMVNQLSRPILRNLPPAFVWTYRLDTKSGEITKGR